MEVKKVIKPKYKMLIILGVVIVGLIILYFSSIGPVNITNKENVEVEIKPGTSRNEIGNILKEKKLLV